LRNFDFLDFGSQVITQKTNKLSKKASTKVPSKADYLPFELSYVNIGAILLLKKGFLQKKKKHHYKINKFSKSKSSYSITTIIILLINEFEHLLQ